MSITESSVTVRKDDKIPPRERILAAAADLFYRHGIRAVGVESIAEAAGTNKMTLYRHFASKDELVAEYLRRLANESSLAWDRISSAHSGEPKSELRAWWGEMVRHAADCEQRGCALVNAAVELPEKEHPARCVIEQHKVAQRHRLAKLCQAAELADPEMLADELFFLLEGARVSAQSMGVERLADRLARMGEAMIKSHEV